MLKFKYTIILLPGEALVFCSIDPGVVIRNRKEKPRVSPGFISKDLFIENSGLF
jgi:hypothetical protein